MDATLSSFSMEGCMAGAPLPDDTRKGLFFPVLLEDDWPELVMGVPDSPWDCCLALVLFEALREVLWTTISSRFCCVVNGSY